MFTLKLLFVIADGVLFYLQDKLEINLVQLLWSVKYLKEMILLYVPVHDSIIQN